MTTAAKTAEVLAALPVIYADEYDRLMNTTHLDEEIIVNQHLTQKAWKDLIVAGVKVSNLRMFTESLHAHLPTLRRLAA